MTATNEKDRFKSRITGNIYEVKRIVNQLIVLESLNGKSQVLTELDNIALFYEREPRKDEDQGRRNSPEYSKGCDAVGPDYIKPKG